MLVEAGLPGAQDRDWGAAAPSADYQAPMSDEEFLEREQMWKENLKDVDTSNMDILEIAQIAAGGPGNSFLPGMKMETISKDDLEARSELSEGTVYIVDDIGPDVLSDAGIPDLDTEEMPGSMPSFLKGMDDFEALAAGLEDINEEETGGDIADQDFEIGDGVEEYLAELEAGQPLVVEPLPGDLPRESFDSYKSRMETLRDHYADQYRKPSERKVPREEAKRIESDFQDMVQKKGLKLPGETKIPVDMSWDKEVRRLAPEPPAEILKGMQRFVWIKLLLRRAHMSRDPLEPAQGLLDSGLLHEACSFGDPFMELKGAPRLLSMLACLRDSGAYSQLAGVFGVQTKDDPPRYYVVVDYFLNLKVPESLMTSSTDPEQQPRILWADDERQLANEAVLVDEEVLEDSLREWKEDDGIGCDWEKDASICTLTVTTKYDIGLESGQVEAITSGWGLLAGSIAEGSFEPLYESVCGGVAEEELWDGETIEHLYHDYKPPEST